MNSMNQRWMNRAAGVLCIYLVSLVVAACGGGGDGDDGTSPPPTPNTVVATVDPAGPISAVVGESRAVRVTFTTDDGRAATNLSITSGMSPLPAGWSSPSPSLACGTVSTGSTCQLDLAYTPVEATPSANLILGYSYSDASGAVKTADVNIAYSSTAALPPNTVVAMVDPAGPVSVSVGQSRAVRITFTTSDGSAATNLSITSGLSALPAGWSGASPGFSCATVSTGSTCQLNLSYTPVAAAPSANLILGYRYTDNTGAVKTADVNIAYSSTTPTAYIVNAGNDTVSRCAIAADGSLSGCRDAGAVGFTALTSIAIKGSNAYITSNGSAKLVRCAIAAADGSFSSCIDAGVGGLSSPYGVDVNGSFLYVSDNGNFIIRCVIASDGTLSDCRNSGATTSLDSPENVLFAGSSAYVVNYGGNSITRCTHNAQDGSLSACGAAAGGLSDPEGGAIKGSMLYIANSSGTDVIQCTIADDGSLSGCGGAGVASLVDNPAQIAINGSTAYIVNYDNETVTWCTIADGGSLTACANSGPAGLSVPYGIAIK
jgi:hypothetical protein